MPKKPWDRQHADPRVREIDQRMTEIAKTYQQRPLPDHIQSEFDELDAKRDKLHEEWQGEPLPASRAHSRPHYRGEHGPELPLHNV